MQLTDEQRQRLASYAAVAHWPAGFTVYQSGTAADGVFVVLRGQLVLRTRLKGGRAYVPAVLTGGELFGVEGLAPGGTYRTDARAETEAETLHLSGARVRALLRERPPDGLALLGQVAAAHAVVLERLRELAMLSVEQRLRAALTRLHAMRADAPPGSPLVLDAAEFRLLCELVGATRESVSLVVNRMVASGAAEREGGTIVIPPEHALVVGARRAGGERERTLALSADPPAAH